MSLHSTMRSAISERPFGLRVRWWSRQAWMMGMIWAGVGFWPGGRMKRRLQRAFRYGVSRVASRDWSSAMVLGKGMSQVSTNLGLGISHCGLGIFAEALGFGFGFSFGIL